MTSSPQPPRARKSAKGPDAPPRRRMLGFEPAAALVAPDLRRAADRARDRGKPANERKAQGRLVEGQIVTNWKQALAQLAAAYPDRINPYL